MFKEISVKDFNAGAYDLFMVQKGVIVAGTQQEIGTMTIGWGTLGCLWNLPVATAYVRPTRHTYKMTENCEYFSLCFFGNYTKELIYLGTSSGYNEDKISKSGLTIAYDNSVAYFEEATTVLICKKIYAQPLLAEYFLDESPIGKFYTKGEDINNFHMTYVGEIVKVMVK